jgi:site-specific DNA recombinase
VHHRSGPLGSSATGPRRPTERPGATVARNGDYLLSGLLRCGRCGGGMILTTRSRGNACVACAAARNRSACEHRKAYDVGKLERLVLDGLREGLTDPARVTEMASAYHERYRENAARQSTERLAVEKRLSRISVMIERLVSAISGTEEPVDEIMARVLPLEAERVGLRERLRLLKGSNIVTMHPNVMEQYRATVERLHT